MELHMVHVNAEEDIAVIGVLYNKGSLDPFISWVISYFKLLLHIYEALYYGHSILLRFALIAMALILFVKLQFPSSYHFRMKKNDND